MADVPGAASDGPSKATGVEHYAMHLEAYDGPEHTPINFGSHKEGVPEFLSHGKSSDGGEVTYTTDGSISTWTSSDGSRSRIYLYEPVIDKNRHEKSGAEPTILLNGSAHQYIRDGDKLVGVEFPAEQLTEKVKVSHLLQSVMESDGSRWERDSQTGKMRQLIGPALTGRTASDGELLPKTILDAAEDKLYATENPIESISAYGVNQGAIGDCYFESGLAGLAKDDPEAIKDMIEDNHDGTFTVTFPSTENIKAHLAEKPDEHGIIPSGMLGARVTVEAPTQAELLAFNRPEWSIPKWRPEKEEDGPNVGYWASVIEKAHRYLIGETAADDGDATGMSLQLLTGKTRDTADLSSFTSVEEDPTAAQYLKEHPDVRWFGPKARLSSEQAGDYIEKALADKKLVLASTDKTGHMYVKSTDPAFPAQSESLYLFPEHVYTVMDYKKAAEGKPAQVVLRNPIGIVGLVDTEGKPQLAGGKKAEGYIEVSVDDFAKLFGHVAVGGR